MKLYFPSAEGARPEHIMELFAAIPYIHSEDTAKWLINNTPYHNYGSFDKLLFNTPIHTFVESYSDCDIVVLPFKYVPNSPVVAKICGEARECGKKVCSFFCDDDGSHFDLPDNLILFRTSLKANDKHPNERAMPVLIPDHMPGNISLHSHACNDVITYCGHLQHGRDKALKHLSSIWKAENLKIVPRAGFWAPGVSKLQARRDYYSNLKSGTYTFCMRGNGNFSYRFYEALSFGRIPILIDTDCVLPLDHVINWDKHIVRIDFDDFMRMNSHDFDEAVHARSIKPMFNRIIWQEYLSFEGYFDNFIREI